MIKVLALSETQVMLYICHQRDDAGYCVEGQSDIQILARSHDELSLRDNAGLMSGLRRACVQPGDLVPAVFNTAAEPPGICQFKCFHNIHMCLSLI